MTPFQRLRDGKSYIFGENSDQKRNLAATGFEVDGPTVRGPKKLAGRALSRALRAPKCREWVESSPRCSGGEVVPFVGMVAQKPEMITPDEWSVISSAPA